mgnify:FL=1
MESERIFRNRPRSVTHIIYAYGSRAPVVRSPNPVSKVKMDHIFDVLFTLRSAQSVSRSSHFGCKYHMYFLTSDPSTPRQSTQLDEICSKLVSTASRLKYYCFPHPKRADTPYFPTFPAGLSSEYC